VHTGPRPPAPFLRDSCPLDHESGRLTAQALARNSEIGLIPLLRARTVSLERLVVPDDMHDSPLHRRVLEMDERTADVLRCFVWEKQTPPLRD
jgi:hypothetical protein